MTAHTIGTREEWLPARVDLLAEEKELARRSDELARKRQALPWVAVEKEYAFETDGGKKTRAEPSTGAISCSCTTSCSARPSALARGGLSGLLVHRGQPRRRRRPSSASGRDVRRGLPCPLENLQAHRRRMGWSFPWVSAPGSDFNLDFSVFTAEERRTGAGFNVGTPRHADEIDLRRDELHGLSAFALEDGVVYHRYSCYDRGTDVLNATWQLFDRTPQCRGDDPEGWPQRHDEYPKGAP